MIRIIAGRWRGKKLQAPSGDGTRPTTDRMRERLFSILQNPRYPALQGARVADLFAGSGALGLEAASRGATHVTFVEQDTAALEIIQSNTAGMRDVVDMNIQQGNALNLPAPKAPFDVIFVDPPYSQGLVERCLAALMGADWLAPGGVIAAESHRDDAPKAPAGLALIDDRAQGIQRIQLYMHAENVE